MKKSTIELVESDKLLLTIFDYIFWILLILYTNPGGIFQALNIWEIGGRYTIKDLLFVLMSLCFVVIPKNYDSFDIDFKSVRNYVLLFMVYYFVVFCYITPQLNETRGYSLLTSLIKSRWVLYNILLFIYIYIFFKRRWDVLLKLFLFSSIIILFLFIQAAITKMDILPVALEKRGFVKMNRLLMLSYGLMPLLIPLGVTAIVFKLRIRYKNLILIGFSLMSLNWLISITRRHILGILIYFILAIVINSYITGSYKVLFNRVVKSVLAIIFITMGIYFIFPKVVDAARVSIIESVDVIETGKESTGKKDERLTLRPFIVTQFINHPILGTGFDNRWRTAKGDSEGYEASDYPFLAALAMFGVVGIIVFIPIYIYLIKILKNDIKYLRAKSKINRSFDFLFIMAFTLFFIFHLFQYFNYFIALSVAEDYTWYFSLSLFLAARSEFYKSEITDNKIEQIIL